MSVIGWDIGGVNTKVARVAGGQVVAVRHQPYELQRAPARLVPLLQELALIVGGDETATHVVTMTAELSQMFRTKREGVHFVLDAMEAAFPRPVVRVFGVDGTFLTVAEARARPLVVAAANWAAAAAMISGPHPDALLVDVGTTTTDIIPIVEGRVVAAGLTDPARLASGELVYTGALRTPVEAIATHVPVAGAMTGVSAEGFALAGDVHLWRGDLSETDYTVPTPDGRPATREYAGERLARVVCADRDLLDEAGVSAIADALARAQIERVRSAMARVVARHPSVRTAVVTGLGAFLGAAAAQAAGLTAVPLSADLGRDAARCAPAVAVALLLDRCVGRVLSAFAPTALVELRRGLAVALRAEADKATADRRSAERGGWSDPPVLPLEPRAIVDLVVKIGGGVLAHPAAFEAVLAMLADELPHQRAVVVPGGGPFADAVRAVDRRLRLTDDEAHWMAIQAMDQYASLIAARMRGAVLVAGPEDVRTALTIGRVPVLAPYRWLRDADPLPHSWDVTSDSLAAWVAGALGAERLAVVKPSGARGDQLVDPEFLRILPATVRVEIVAADEVERLGSFLRTTAIGARTPEPGRSEPDDPAQHA